MSPLHRTQRLLLDLSKRRDLGQLKLREMADLIDLNIAPQLIRFHLESLKRKGLLTVDKEYSWSPAQAKAARSTQGLASSGLLSIPVVGAANCGPANLLAVENLEGFLHVSPRLIGRDRPSGLFAIRASGTSMNRASVAGRTIDDGDHVVADSNMRSPRTNDIVVAILGGRATIKRFVDDRKNGQVVLRADSSQDFEPVHLHPDDDFQISGKVIAVVKKAR